MNILLRGRRSRDKNIKSAARGKIRRAERRDKANALVTAWLNRINEGDIIIIRHHGDPEQAIEAKKFIEERTSHPVLVIDALVEITAISRAS